MSNRIKQIKKVSKVVFSVWPVLYSMVLAWLKVSGSIEISWLWVLAPIWLLPTIAVFLAVSILLFITIAVFVKNLSE